MFITKRKHEAVVEGLLRGIGYVYFNPDTGEEYGRNHPIESGEVLDAEDVRRSTGMEDALNSGMQRWFRRADQADKMVKHGTSVIEAYAAEVAELKAEIEALKIDAEKWRNARAKRRGKVEGV